MLEPIRRCLSRVLGFVLVVAFAGATRAETPDAGTVPVGADGKPLNLGFEDGTLKDWTATGDAFKGQPIKGDTVAARGRAGMKSNHAGDYWVGTYEVSNSDKQQGNAHQRAVQGDAAMGEFSRRRRGVARDAGRHRAGGRPESDLHRVRAVRRKTWPASVVDLKAVVGKEIFIRVVDDSSGPWGHINFDDFRFHETQPSSRRCQGVGG